MQWFNHALAAQLHEPYAMSLATANAQGRPHVRTVLLRGATEAGYDFYTNYDSQKGLDLAENPYAELLFYWQEQERQIRISGKVVKISEEESTDYYHKRPRESQIAAHISTRKAVWLRVVKNYSNASGICISRSPIRKSWISRDSGVAIVCSQIIMNSGRAVQTVYMTA